ncbi:hypothetical protein J699_01297 [Acinetobacter sp. 1000160]|nr:hypothetical protein J522_0526 [Acinetobacter baumannii 146457]EYT22350.1 hypothetical protein J699_01297 [Acinetobacter sp. 1000160]
MHDGNVGNKNQIAHHTLSFFANSAGNDLPALLRIKRPEL